MAKISSPNITSNITTLQEFIRFQSIFNSDVYAQLSGGISFQDNIDIVIIEQKFSAANIDFAIAHTLGRTPIGYIPVVKDIASDFFKGDQGWTANNIVLRASVAGVTAQFIIF